MKNSRTNNIRILIAAVMFITSTNAAGQEFIKEISIKHTTSLIREVGIYDWLTCTNHADYSTFALVNNLNLYVQRLTLPEGYIVNDFEIYEDTAFFCGYRQTDSTIGIFGYFDLATFPYGNVYCCLVPGVVEYKKMTVFTKQGNPHFVFTGESDYTSIISDAIRNIPHDWHFSHSSHNNNFKLIYDDVAATEDHIVVSHRKYFGQTANTGYLNFFDKPTTYTSIFPQYAMCRNVQYSMTSPILITACDGNRFATVCDSLLTHIIMSKYNYYNDIVSLKTTINKVSMQDIKFNKGSKNIDVLVYSDIYKYGSSIALHYDQSIVGSTTIPVHIFTGELLHSMDYLVQQSDCFIASGSASNDVLLRVYRYKYDEWRGCFSGFSTPAIKVDNDLEYDEYLYVPTTVDKKAQLIECEHTQVLWTSLCDD